MRGIAFGSLQPPVQVPDSPIRPAVCRACRRYVREQRSVRCEAMVQTGSPTGVPQGWVMCGGRFEAAVDLPTYESLGNANSPRFTFKIGDLIRHTYRTKYPGVEQVLRYRGHPDSADPWEVLGPTR